MLHNYVTMHCGRAGIHTSAHTSACAPKSSRSRWRVCVHGCILNSFRLGIISHILVIIILFQNKTVLFNNNGKIS